MHESYAMPQNGDPERADRPWTALVTDPNKDGIPFAARAPGPLSFPDGASDNEGGDIAVLNALNRLWTAPARSPRRSDGARQSDPATRGRTQCARCPM